MTEAEIVERVARIINPIVFKSWQGMIDHCLASGDSEESARRYADNTYGDQCEKARSDATAAIAAMPPTAATVNASAIEAEVREAGQALLRELEWVNEQLDLMPDDYAEALTRFQAAIRSPSSGEADGGVG